MKSKDCQHRLDPPSDPPGRLETRDQVTDLLRRWAAGDPSALDRLTPLVYGSLRRLAHEALKGESRSVPIETTGLVHEAFLRLLKAGVDWQDRRHFIALSARLIRRVLVDLARERKSMKRGHGIPHLALTSTLKSPEQPTHILALNDALDALGHLDPRKARVVELRFFAGLTTSETADVLEVSSATVERDLRAAKAWLAREMDPILESSEKAH